MFVANWEIGKKIGFWKFIWMGNEPFSFVFPLIFNIAANRDAKIADKGLWINGAWVWKINLDKKYLDAMEAAQLIELY